MNKIYKLKLTADDVRVLINALQCVENSEAVMLQLEVFIADIEFNETVNECEIDSDVLMYDGSDDEGCSL